MKCYSHINKATAYKKAFAVKLCFFQIKGKCIFYLCHFLGLECICRANFRTSFSNTANTVYFECIDCTVSTYNIYIFGSIFDLTAYNVTVSAFWVSSVLKSLSFLR